MLSRALILATVTLSISCFATAPLYAQATNLEAGKSPSQIFAGTCTACHKSPRGLLKSVPAGSLPGFLRQHYTTSPEMAGVLSSYLISNGANDPKYMGNAAKPDKDGKSEAKPSGPPEQRDRQGRRIHTSEPAADTGRPEAEPQQAARPDADGLPPNEGGRKGRKRLARPAEEGAKPAEGETAIREPAERGPDGRKLTAKQRRLSKRGKPVEEMPAGETGKDEPAAAAREEKPRGEFMKDEAAKLSAEPKSESAKVDAPRDSAPREPVGQTPVATRPDPVPAVVPAPPAAAAAMSSPEPAAAAPPVARTQPAAETAAPAASVPAPSGSPTPPISR